MDGVEEKKLGKDFKMGVCVMHTLHTCTFFLLALARTALSLSLSWQPPPYAHNRTLPPPAGSGGEFSFGEVRPLLLRAHTAPFSPNSDDLIREGVWGGSSVR